MSAIGADPGHKRTKGSYLDAAGKFTSILSSRGNPSFASVVAYASNGDVLVGDDALEYAFLEPERCAQSFKLQLGTTEPVLRDGSTKTARECTAELLRLLKRSAELALNCVVADVVLTCPVKFNDAQKADLIAAAKDAGLNVLRIISEPVAAAVAYGLMTATDPRVVLVVDIGGGTTDVSVVRIENGRIEVIASDGENPLGGSDVDEQLWALLLDAVEAESGTRPSVKDSPQFFAHAAPLIEQAKISLSAGRDSAVAVAHNGHQVTVSFTLTQFQEIMDSLIQRVMAVTDRTLAAAGMNEQDIDDFLLIGAASRCPYLRDKLSEHVGRAPRGEVNPDSAPAHGAASIAANELRQQGRASSLGHQTIPTPGVFVRDATPHAVGCAVLDHGTGDLRNSPIIPKNTPIPCMKADEFYLEREDQTTATIEVLQGEADAKRDECLTIGTLKLEKLPPEPTRTQRIRVEYSLDRNGMVHVTATDKVSGQSVSVSIDMTNGDTSSSDQSNTTTATPAPAP